MAEPRSCDSDRQGARRQVVPYEDVISGTTLWLLRAIFDQEPPLEDAEDQLASLHEGEVDWADFQLLPLMAGRPEMLGLDNPLCKRLKGIRRLVWYKNQLLLKGFALLLSAFREAGIRTMLLGDVVSASLLFEKASVRPIHRLTMLIEPDRPTVAMEILKTHGWWEKNALRNIDPVYLPGQDYWKQGVDALLDLRWHLLSACCYPGAERDVWKRARPLSFEGAEAWMPDFTDQILFLAERAMESEPSQAVLYVADALQILHSPRHEIDWGLLLAKAQSRFLITPVARLLGFLSRNFRIDAPPGFLDALADIPASMTERLDARYRQFPADRRFLGELPVLYFAYRRYSNIRPSEGGARGFGAYLKAYWRVDSNCELMRLIALLSRRRIVKGLTQARNALTQRAASHDL